MLLKLICAFVLCSLHTNLVYSQNCSSDCVKVLDCPQAILLLRTRNSTTTALLRSAACGFVGQSPTVCCQNLSPATPLEQRPDMQLLPENCGLIDQERIVGGNETGLYEFPWMVLLSYRTKRGLDFKCGGSLINDRYVLTAAHCVVGRRLVGVRIGEHDIRTPIDCQGDTPPISCEQNLQDIGVEKEIPHKDYTRLPKISNDIALLRLAKPVDLTPRNARPICLPYTAEMRARSLDGVNATVAGWGNVEDRLPSPVLLKVNIPIYNAEQCKNFYKGEDLTYKLCAGKMGSDSCQGDSGGPLMVPGTHQNHERYVQRGIVSYGPQKCGANYPGIYTELAPYMQWILDNIKP